MRSPHVKGLGDVPYKFPFAIVNGGKMYFEQQTEKVYMKCQIL